MTTAMKEAQKHIGETQAVKNHDHDLIHELSKRIDAVWRYDQYIANAEGHADLQEFWRALKKQDQKNVDQLRQLIRQEIDNECF